MSKKISVAVLGCGMVGNGVMKNIEDMPEVEAIYGYDVNPDQLEESLKKGNSKLVRVTTDLDEILSNEDIKLVYVTSSNASHVPLAIASLRAGKAVMTEKPTGLNEEEIQELIDVQKETGGFLQVGFECRYSKAYVYIKDIVDSGEIGKLVNVHFTYAMSPYPKYRKGKDGSLVPNWRVNRDLAGSMYHEKLCHYIDLVRWWNEGSRVCRYVCTGFDNVIPYFGIEDNVHVSYQFDNGCTSHLNFNMNVAPHGNTNMLGDWDLSQQDKDGHKLNYVLTGTEGAIEMDVFQRQVRVYHHPGKPGVDKAKIDRILEWGPEGDGDPNKENRYFHDGYTQNRDIVRRVVNGQKPAIDIEDAQESIRLCMEFTKTTAEKRWTIVER